MKPGIFFFLCVGVLFGGENRLYLPHFTDKAGEWQTQIALNNPNTTSSLFSMEAYSEDGSPLGDASLRLEPKGGLHADLAQLMPEIVGQTGWLIIDCSRGELSGLAIFNNLVTGGSTSLPLVEQMGTVLNLPFLENHDNLLSGFVLTNPSDSELQLSLTLQDLASPSAQCTVVNLAPGAKIRGIAADFFEQPPPDRASLRVEADQPVLGLALTFQDGLKQIIAVPALVLGTNVQRVFQTQVDQAFEDFIHPGISVAIWPENKGAMAALAGVADKETGAAMTLERSADIGSVTKAFVATLILMLRDEGLLSLDDSLNNWQPQFPRANEVTVRMLLNHTSGIFNYSNTSNFYNFVINNMVNTKPVTPGQLIGFAMAGGVNGYAFSPGTSWGYSNTNYIMLGTIIEAVTGDTLAAQLHRRIFDPLGMTHSYLAGDEPVPHRSRQYWYGTPGEPTDITDTVHMSINWAAGAIASNTEEIMVFYRALFQGKLLPTSSLNEMTTPTGMAIEAEYGFGITVGLFQGHLLYSHSGRTWGGSAFAGYFPQLGSTFALQINASAQFADVAQLRQIATDLLLNKTEDP